jgi:hypothetical protein
MSKFIKTKGGVNERRKRVVARLEKQLKVGKKTIHKDFKGIIELTDADRARIEKELQTLKSRII